MDETDLKIVKQLLVNCRLTYREIAQTLDISVNAVYKRVQNMISARIIMSFTAKPSLTSLKGINVLIYGKTSSKNLNVVSKELGDHECVYFVGNAAGSILYIDGYLRNISELHEYTSFVINIGQMEENIVGIRKVPYQIIEENLTSLDYEILKSLKNDARKPIVEIVEDVGISAKTVRKRLLRMMDNHLVEFSINFAPRAEGTIVSSFNLYLSKGLDYNEQFERINEKYIDKILYLHMFSNIPNLIIMTTLTKSNDETVELYSNLTNENYTEVKHDIIFNGFFFETWRDKLYREMIGK